jgi:predicted Zn-dependent peptidase
LTARADGAGGHAVLRRVLPSGLEVVVAPQPHLHTACVALFVGVGSRHESRAESGLSHLLEHMLFRGTARLPSAYALNHAIESLGGTL